MSSELRAGRDVTQTEVTRSTIVQCSCGVQLTVSPLVLIRFGILDPVTGKIVWCMQLFVEPYDTTKA